MSNYIPLVECEDRRLYEISSRNLVVGAFDTKNKGFIGLRQKFDNIYLFEEYHYDIGPPFGTVRPTKALDVVVPEDIELVTLLPGADCSICSREVEFREDVPGAQPTLGKWFHVEDDTELEEGGSPMARINTALTALIEANTDMSVFISVRNNND